MRITLLGIDGSGKSTLSKLLKEYFEKNGYSVKIVPFHKWVFADFFRDKLKIGKIIDRKRSSRGTSYYAPSKKSFSAFIKPPIALIDNIIFYLINRPKKNEIYIYDRFICATQIKLTSLNYHTKWIEFIWKNIMTEYTFYIDVDPQISVDRQKLRSDPYLYPKSTLTVERDLYLEMATKHDLPIIKNDGKIEKTFSKVIKIIENNKL